MSIYDHIPFKAHVGRQHIPKDPIISVSSRGQKLLHEFEGYRANAYPDPGTGDEPWTIGYGSTVYPNGRKVRKGDVVSRDEAARIFAHDLNKFTRAVLQATEVPLNQNQLDALVSLTYNIGKNAFRRSTLLKRLNAGDYIGAADQFLVWRRSGGRVMDGLVNRRKRERELFLE